MLSLTLSACGEKKIICVGSQWYGHAPVWVGIERGIFAKHGLEVEWRPIGKSMDRLIAIISGSAHFASLGEIAMLKAMSRDQTGFYWVGNQDIAPGFEGLVARPGIRTFEDLRGKKIGFPFSSSVDLTCRILLKQNGLDPQKDVKLVNLEVGDVPNAFANGLVDAALIWEPGFTQLKEVEGATVLGMDTDTEIYKRFKTMTGPDVLIISKSWVDKKPQEARTFMKAYFEAVSWVKAHSDETAEIILEKKYIQQKEDVLKRDLKRFVWHELMDQKQVMSDEGIFGQAEYVVDMFLKEIGGDTIEKKPNFKKWVKMDLLFPPEGESAPRKGEGAKKSGK
jgi:ABC-type nitrate/sulfonate/bicarbonate transport system substrate-binding protein